MEFESIEQFKKLGYLVQLPGLSDNTYFMIRHGNKGTRRIYVRVTKKLAKISVFENNTACQLNRKERSLIDKLVFEDLKLQEYKYI